MHSSPAGVSIPQLQSTVEFLESLIWIVQDWIIRSLSLTGNCMQSEGELRFCISLYEAFVNLDIKNTHVEIFVIQSRNTVRKRINGEKSETDLGLFWKKIGCRFANFLKFGHRVAPQSRSAPPQLHRTTTQLNFSIATAPHQSSTRCFLPQPHGSHTTPQELSTAIPPHRDCRGKVPSLIGKLNIK